MGLHNLFKKLFHMEENNENVHDDAQGTENNPNTAPLDSVGQSHNEPSSEEKKEYGTVTENAPVESEFHEESKEEPVLLETGPIDSVAPEETTAPAEALNDVVVEPSGEPVEVATHETMESKLMDPRVANS